MYCENVLNICIQSDDEITCKCTKHDEITCTCNYHVLIIVPYCTFADTALPGCPVSHKSSGRPRQARRRRGVKENIHLQR